MTLPGPQWPGSGQVVAEMVVVVVLAQELPKESVAVNRLDSRAQTKLAAAAG